MRGVRAGDLDGRARRVSLNPMRIERSPLILLARPDHLGDVLLTLPAAAALRTALPDAHLSYLVADGLEPVPSMSPAVDEVITAPFPRPDAAWPTPGWVDAARQTADRLRRFDMVVLLRPEDPWTGVIAAAADIPIRVGYARDRTRPFLTHAMGRERAGRHAVRLAADVLALACAALGRSLPPLDEPGPGLTLAPEDESTADQVLADVRDRTTERPVVLHPGSGWPLKSWPVPRWAAVARTIKRRHGVDPLVLGSASDARLCDDVVRASSGHAVSIAPLSMGALAAIHRRARLVVSIDSGAVHLAALVGAPVVALFGPGDPATARPWSPSGRQRVVRVDLECSPCGRMHDPPCGATAMPRCVAGVTVEAVTDAIDDLIGAP
jgi:ADP-heptose:LPS heptosyltransferase